MMYIVMFFEGKSYFLRNDSISSTNTLLFSLLRVISEVIKSYQPNAIVMQCGADGLAGDKLGGFNLTLKSYTYCVKYILSLHKPTLLLGGGKNLIATRKM